MSTESVVALVLLTGLLAAAGIVIGLGPPGRVASAARWITGGLLLAVIGIAQFSAGFDGYVTDLWFYVVVIERVADGQPVWDREPFRLEGPSNPQVTAPWILLGLLRRQTGLGPLTLIRLQAAAVTVLLCFAAWRLARRLFPESRHQWAAVVLFWLAMPQQWWQVALGKNISLVFALLAAASVLDLTDRDVSEGGWPAFKRAAGLALWLAFALHSHLFGGMLAIAGVGLVLLARWRQGHPPPWRELLLAIAMAALLTAPVLSRALATWGLLRNTAHLAPRGGEIHWLGLSWLAPSHFLGLMPWPLYVLVIIGLLSRPRHEHRFAQSLARLGTLFALALLVTPLYHLGALLVSGWLVVRVVALAFPWIAATLALARLHAEHAPPAHRAAAALLLAGLTCGAGLEMATALLDRSLGLRGPLGRARARAGPVYFHASPEAQAEAFRLRPLLRNRVFVTADELGYGVAGGTLGRPLAIPPGHSSPYDDSAVRRKRWMDRALSVNTKECWGALFRVHPEIEFLLTPTPQAAVEYAVWAARLPQPPELVRERLAAWGALRPAFEGLYFRLDHIRDPLPEASLGPPTAGEGRGRLCP